MGCRIHFVSSDTFCYRIGTVLFYLKRDDPSVGIGTLNSEHYFETDGSFIDWDGRKLEKDERTVNNIRKLPEYIQWSRKTFKSCFLD